MKRLVRWRLGGAFLIGMVFGLVSTPCATPPLGMIMIIAADSGMLYALALLLAFALGHGSLLVAVGLSQRNRKPSPLHRLSRFKKKSVKGRQWCWKSA